MKGTPELREVKDPFGNTQRLGILGITRATSPGEVTTEKVDPASAFWLGIKETWFVIDQTLSYIGNIFTGRASADQIGGPIRIAQISGQVATLGLIRPDSSGGGAVDFDRAVEPVPGALARWRSPFVLRGRGGAGASLVGEIPGDTGSASGWFWC